MRTMFVRCILTYNHTPNQIITLEGLCIVLYCIAVGFHNDNLQVLEI